MQATFPIIPQSHITGLILAGGKARRLNGQDKGLIRLGNQTLVEYVITRLHGQTKTLIINANRHQDIYQGFGYPVIADELPDFAGPLAGLHAGLQHMSTEWLLSVPCDNPGIPANLVAQLVAMANQKQCLLTVASCDGQLQPVYCLLHRSLQASLQAYLASGQHKVQDWLQQQTPCIVEFSDCGEFENINTPEQLAEAESLL